MFVLNCCFCTINEYLRIDADVSSVCQVTAVHKHDDTIYVWSGFVYVDVEKQ